MRVFRRFAIRFIGQHHILIDPSLVLRCLNTAVSAHYAVSHDCHSSLSDALGSPLRYQCNAFAIGMGTRRLQSSRVVFVLSANGLYALIEQFTALIKLMPNAVFINAGKGRLIIANESAKQLFKLSNYPPTKKLRDHS